MLHRKLLVLTIMIIALLPASIASACGGLFCQNIPVDQQGERIIFTMNGDGTVSAYVQINYTGSAPDFSWVVPVPSVPQVDVAEMASFTELQMLTDPIIVGPQMPDCAVVPMPMVALGNSVVEEESDDVQVLASGTAGPFAFDVVTSENPESLIIWLNDNNYRITEEMKPFVAVYTAEDMVFLAMKLQPEQGVQDIQPVVMTYEAEYPTIPIRLTAVAANPNMSIYTWIFANEQAVPMNYAHPTIADENLRGDFFSFGGTNYMTLVDQTVDLYAGRAFITEYAQPTSAFMDLRPQDALVKELTRDYRYVTRLFGRMSPEEMTVDPSFTFNGNMQNVDNLRDLSNANPKVFWNCDEVPVRIEYDASVVPAGF